MRWSKSASANPIENSQVTDNQADCDGQPELTLYKPLDQPKLQFHNLCKIQDTVIEATEVLGRWEKKGKKNTVGRGPGAGSGRPGRSKIRVGSWAGAKNSPFDFSRKK